jgi:hypothetical protein
VRDAAGEEGYIYNDVHFPHDHVQKVLAIYQHLALPQSCHVVLKPHPVVNLHYFIHLCCIAKRLFKMVSKRIRLIFQLLTSTDRTLQLPVTSPVHPPIHLHMRLCTFGFPWDNGSQQGWVRRESFKDIQANSYQSTRSLLEAGENR